MYADQLVVITLRKTSKIVNKQSLTKDDADEIFICWSNDFFFITEVNTKIYQCIFRHAPDVFDKNIFFTGHRLTPLNIEDIFF